MTHKTNLKYASLTLAAALSLMAAAFSLIGAAPAQAQFSVGDREISGSLCVGLDCVNGESFGFDTLRLKENNLRMHFQDTSTSASFPTNDWRIIANDSANGGASYLAFEDSNAGRIPFRVEAGARANALYVEGDGDIGIGTNNPVVDLHIKTGNTPTLRLEQDGSSGFTPQTWDVAGNEANFFVRDATNGSKLPFKIKPNAPTSSIFIEGTTGDIGLGTESPDGALDVEGAGTMLALLTSTDNGAVQWRLKGDSGAGDNNRRIVALDSGNSVESQIVLGDGTVKIAGATDTTDLFATFSSAGIVTNIGSCTTASPCDAVFDPEVYTVPSIEDHAAFMWENKYLPAVGSTQQGEPINIVAKMTSILNELEHAHIYIEELNAELKAQGDEIEALKALLTER